MYRCNECGHLFEDGEQSHWVEPHGEEMFGCPLCDGNFKEVYPCKVCGEYEQSADNGVCEECIIQTKEKYKKMMSENFTEEEKQILFEMFEEGELW